MIMNFYRHIDRSKVQFDFLVHRDFRADYDDEIEALGGRIFRIPRLIPWSRTYRVALRGFFKEHPEYRIVHVHQDCMSAVILREAKLQGVPVRIAHSHNSSQDKNLKYLIKLYYKRQIPRYATQLFACGKDAGDWMFDGAPYQIVRNAVDARQYRYDPVRAANAKKSMGITPECFVIGHVGRFAPVKNHMFLLDIFQKIRASEPRSMLLLVGDGELKQQVEQNADEMGLSDSVCFAGVRDDVPEMMQAMDAFVFPSLYEGLPVSLVEAQAAGLPCFISDQVPEACDLTKLIHRISLRQDAQHWAQRVLESRSDSRSDMYCEIVACGFDIVSNSAWLQQYYIDKWKEQE